MTQRPDPSKPNTDEVDNAFEEHESTGDIDALAALLSESFDAPAVPASLSRRLDDEIGRRWDRSPNLVPSRSVSFGRVASWGGRQLRSWRGAAATAALVLLAVVAINGSGGRAWAAVRAAMEQHGVLEIRSDDSVRWLDLSERIAGRQTNEGSELFDLRNRVFVKRSASEPNATRKPLPPGLNPSANAMVFAFLTDQPLTIQAFESLGDVQVVSQHAVGESAVNKNTGDDMPSVLAVRFQTSANPHVTVQLTLDDNTSLPVAVTNRDAVASVRMSSRSIAALTSERFPGGTIAGVDAHNPAGELLASQGGEANDPGTDPGVNEAAMQPRPLQERPNPTQVAQLPGAAVEGAATTAAMSSLPVGAAKQWPEVAVVSRADDEVLSRVNATLASLWAERGVVPVERASDVQLLRRAYLDLAGRTPTVTEVRQFLNNDDVDRYEQLVDQLIESPDHASQLAAVWRSFLIPEGVNLDAFGGRVSFEEWLAKRFGSGAPYDQIVRELLLAEGRLAQSGPLLFYSALKLDADQLAARTSRAFLGMRLECAQCHDHPFEPWTQEDFWSYAAFFAQISRPKGELENASTVMQVRDVNRGEVMIPYTDEVVSPRLLGPDSTVNASLAVENLAEENLAGKESSGRRQVLSDWLTSRENPYFARATVNRLWAYFFGRGIVDPVDDFGVANEPVSPALLDTLASQLIESEFDLSRSIRTIVLSDAYRLGSGAVHDLESSGPKNSDLRNSDLENGALDESGLDQQAEARLAVFAQMNVKTLTAEQLYDCIAVATMLDASGNAGDYSVYRFGNTQRDAFLQTFAAPASSRSDYLAGIPQALTLMNGSLIDNATSDASSGRVKSLQAPFFSDTERIGVLFMATLSRPASADEQELLADLIPDNASWEQRSTALSDILWALLNSSEFTLNH